MKNAESKIQLQIAFNINAFLFLICLLELLQKRKRLVMNIL